MGSEPQCTIRAHMKATPPAGLSGGLDHLEQGVIVIVAAH